MISLTKQFDAFISHASEDKEDFVRPLANMLSSMGAKVWFDEFSLQIGKSLSRSIDKGLGNSQYGIIVLSKAFFAKDWPEYELKSLNALEIGNEGVILPVWHKISREDVLKCSPFLADKLAISSSKFSIEEISVKLLDIIRPDLSENYHKRKVWESLGQGSGEVKKGTPNDFSHQTLFRHKTLPESLLTRIRFIRAALLSGYPNTFEYWVEGFKRDLHPEREIENWEKISTCYLEAIQASKINPTMYPEIFNAVFSILSNDGAKYIKKETKLPKDTIEKVKKICKYSTPYFEIKDRGETWDAAKFDVNIYEEMGKAKK